MQHLISKTMINLIFLALFCLTSSKAQQYYDPFCNSNIDHPGSRYTCNFSEDSCSTFLVFRANQDFPTITSISDLFGISSDKLLPYNGMTSPLETLKTGREVIVPIKCYCSGMFFQSNITYTVPKHTTFSDIACGVFEGLVKSLILGTENPEIELETGSKLHVPLKCACPDNGASTNGVKYLVTYPVIAWDEPNTISDKFGISPEDFWAANNLNPQKPTIFPNSSVLVPLRSDPVINISISNSPPPVGGFSPAFPMKKMTKRLKRLFIAVSITGFCLVIIVLLTCWLYLKTLKKLRNQNFRYLTARSSPINLFSPLPCALRSVKTGQSSVNSCLSPDLLAGIKFSLFNYSIQELRRATRDFAEETKVGSVFYKGVIDNVEVMIKRAKFEDTSWVIDIYSKINHINILDLHGVTHGESDSSGSYLVFEFPNNGCLRDCLCNSSNPLCWNQRTQIAFDIATGLNYLHCCAFPSYSHMCVNSKNVFVTEKWRAKLANIGTIYSPKQPLRENDNDKTESLSVRVESEKGDIFAFGVVLLELISAREDDVGTLLTEVNAFLGGGDGENGCFEMLRNFMDPNLGEEYPLAEALCLAVLAKACVEDDPLHRPSLDDIMKVLTRIV